MEEIKFLFRAWILSNTRLWRGWDENCYADDISWLFLPFYFSFHGHTQQEERKKESSFQLISSIMLIS